MPRLNTILEDWGALSTVLLKSPENPTVPKTAPKVRFSPLCLFDVRMSGKIRTVPILSLHADSPIVTYGLYTLYCTNPH
jgi:hypothetical protein